MTPHHDQLLSAGWTTEDARLYRRGAVVLVCTDSQWVAGCGAAISGIQPTPDAALATLRQRLHDRIAEARRALEDLP